jgi:hypothetical protein
MLINAYTWIHIMSVHESYPLMLPNVPSQSYFDPTSVRLAPSPCTILILLRSYFGLTRTEPMYTFVAPTFIENHTNTKTPE